MIVWILNDGKIGDDVQCVAIAEALSDNPDKRTIAPRFPWSLMAPWGPIDPADNPTKNLQSPIAGAPPDIVVASGRRAIPYGVYLKKRHNARLVILKDPRVGRALADFIWVPAHDELSGSNVFSTLTSPHAMSAKIAAAKKSSNGSVAKLPGPLLGVILGGPSGGAEYTQQTADDLSSRINDAMKDFASLAVTPSRRTPPDFMARVAQSVMGDNRMVWNRNGNNPYIDILAHSSSLIVAGDSHNMVSEALASGTGLYIWQPAGLIGKLSRFISELTARGQARVFERRATPFAITPVDATQEIVDEIERRFGKF